METEKSSKTWREQPRETEKLRQDRQIRKIVKAETETACVRVCVTLSRLGEVRSFKTINKSPQFTGKTTE